MDNINNPRKSLDTRISRDLAAVRASIKFEQTCLHCRLEAKLSSPKRHSRESEPEFWHLMRTANMKAHDRGWRGNNEISEREQEALPVSVRDQAWERTGRAES